MSEVAWTRVQIELEQTAARQGLGGLACVASHEIITARMAGQITFSVSSRLVAMRKPERSSPMINSDHFTSRKKRRVIEHLRRTL